MITRTLRITGTVQGVGYRESMRREALNLGVAGWVRNRLDGSVEALAQGQPEAVAALIAWARIGPPAAQVADVSTSDAQGEHDRSYSGFQLRTTV